jgi:hypothetical protein
MLVTGKLAPAPMDPNTDIKTGTVVQQPASIQAAISRPQLRSNKAGAYSNSSLEKPVHRSVGNRRRISRRISRRGISRRGISREEKSQGG